MVIMELQDISKLIKFKMEIINKYKKMFFKIILFIAIIYLTTWIIDNLPDIIRLIIKKINLWKI
jgi:hypothetical protein